VGRASLVGPASAGGLTKAGLAGAGVGVALTDGASSLQAAARTIAKAAKKVVVRFMVFSLCRKIEVSRGPPRTRPNTSDFRGQGTESQPEV
jgi:hypothetical protein